MDILNKMRQILVQAELEHELVLVAVSGGVDSLVLLHTLASMQKEFGYTLHAATFDHGLRGEESLADAKHATAFAQSLGIPIEQGSGDIAPNDNLEAAARQARYGFLAELALKREASYIAVGHHMDDQVETVLMNLLRGTGLTGLGGMRPISGLSAAHLPPESDEDFLYDAEEIDLLRPLLDVSRSEIAAYAEAHAIIPREDSTNQDPTYTRNRLRHELLPIIDAINPHARKTIARMAHVLHGDDDVIRSLVDSRIAEIMDWGETNEGEVVYVDRHTFVKYSPGLQRQILRRMVHDLAPRFRDITFEQIEEARDLIQHGTPGKQMTLPADLILTTDYDEFTVHYGGELPFPPYIPNLQRGQVIPLDAEQPKELGALRLQTYWVHDRLSQEVYQGNPLEATLAISPNAELSIRTRRTGDRFRPLGMQGHSQKLSDIFTNLKVPKHLRDRVALLTADDEIVWFVVPTMSGLQGRIAESAAVTPESKTVLRLRWEPLQS